MTESLAGPQADCDEACEAPYVRPDVVSAVTASMPSLEDIHAMAETFKLLGDPSRLRIIHALSRGELCVCDLAEMLGIARPAVSNHLRLLRSMRLVSHRREGKLVFYSLADDHIAALLRECLTHIQEPAAPGA